MQIHMMGDILPGWTYNVVDRHYLEIAIEILVVRTSPVACIDQSKHPT